MGVGFGSRLKKSGSHVTEAEREDGGPPEPVQGRRRCRGGTAAEGGQHGGDPEEPPGGEPAEEEEGGDAGAAVPDVGAPVGRREEGLGFLVYRPVFRFLGL